MGRCSFTSRGSCTGLCKFPVLEKLDLPVIVYKATPFFFHPCKIARFIDVEWYFSTSQSGRFGDFSIHVQPLVRPSVRFIVISVNVPRWVWRRLSSSDSFLSVMTTWARFGDTLNMRLIACRKWKRHYFY